MFFIKITPLWRRLLRDIVEGENPPLSAFVKAAILTLLMYRIGWFEEKNRTFEESLDCTGFFMKCLKVVAQALQMACRRV